MDRIFLILDSIGLLLAGVGLYALIAKRRLLARGAGTLALAAFAAVYFVLLFALCRMLWFLWFGF
jgi:hypothetical protein